MTHGNELIDTGGAAGTGPGPTFIVAVEQQFPKEKRIIEDALAVQILPRVHQWFVALTNIPVFRDWIVRATENSLSGGWSAFTARKRYIDDRLVEAAADNAVDAVVNLGAGYDTRLYRLPALQQLPAWEVDQPVNINGKRKGIESVLGNVPAHVVLVPINFIEQDIADVLQQHGYASDYKTFFIWEAVSQYLTEPAVRNTFEFFAAAPPGSRLAFTYVLKDFIEGKAFYGQEKAYQRMVVKDQIWHFGFDPNHIEAFLHEYGWQLIEDISYAELADRYARSTGRQLASLDIERMVFTEKSRVT